MTKLFRGMMASPAGRAGGFFAEKARDALNPSPNSADNTTNLGGFDLLAWNINRGRDHGLPREYFGEPLAFYLVSKCWNSTLLHRFIKLWMSCSDWLYFSAYHTWLTLTTQVKPKGWRFFKNFFERGDVTVYALKSVYKSWKDIDLYLGGLLEKVDRDSSGRRNQVPTTYTQNAPICTMMHKCTYIWKVVGPTHAKLIASQFARLRKGDRFFYEDDTQPRTKLHPHALREIKKVTFAHILCNNLNPEGSDLSNFHGFFCRFNWNLTAFLAIYRGPWARVSSSQKCSTQSGKKKKSKIELFANFEREKAKSEAVPCRISKFSPMLPWDFAVKNMKGFAIFLSKRRQYFTAKKINTNRPVCTLAKIYLCPVFLRGMQSFCEKRKHFCY